MSNSKVAKEKKNPLEDLTLVVPTYFRQAYALRLMRYWNGKGVKLIVVDGTDSPITPENLADLSRNILYVHNPVGMYQRLSGCLDLVATKYVALAGDDEFYIPSAIQSCINELEHSPSMAACCGRALAFELTSSKIYGGLIYPRLHNYALTEESPKDRVFQHLRNYVPSLVYAISRTDEWKKIWKKILALEFNVYAIAELQFEIGMSYAGKSKVIPELMWLRSFGENAPTRGTDKFLDTSKQFHVWWTSDLTHKNREVFLKLMESLLCCLKNYEEQDQREVVIEGLNAYVSQVLVQLRKRRFDKWNPIKIPMQMAKILPQDFKDFLRLILKVDNGLISAALKLQNQGVKVDFEQLHRILSILYDFHGLSATPQKSAP